LVIFGSDSFDAVIVIEAIEINRIKKTLDANGIPVAPVVII